MKGQIKFYIFKKKFGFITGEDGKEYFFHMSGIAPDVRINKDDHVTFDLEETEKGPKAVNIKVVGGGSPAPTSEDNADEDESNDEDFEE